jgi:hypothetical protein
MSSFTHAYCATCKRHDYVVPLHGERGGPLCCLLCAGKWNAEHVRRRRAGRVVIKALKGYFAAGGKLCGADLDKLKLAAAGMSIVDDKFLDAAGADDFSDLTSELLDATIALTHPDKHPPERKDEANRVTQELLALRPFVFPAVKPEPPKPKNDVCSKSRNDDFKQPSRPAYPCDDCRDTVPSFYCDACKAQFEKEKEKKREREDRKRLEKNARQRKRYKEYRQIRKSEICGSCEKKFEPKRSDAKYCSAACRQRAYVKRDGKPSNLKPIGQQEIEQTIRDLFTCNDSAFTVDDLCGHVYLGLKQPQRKHRAAVLPIAKKVCEQLGEDWQWWRTEKRGGTLVFFNHAIVMSYAMARLKADFCHNSETEEELRASISPGGRYHDYVVKGGAWWKYCQDHINETTNQKTAAAI